jgi:hypothetical protein
MPPIERTGIASQALNQAEVTKKSADISPVSPAAATSPSSQQLSAQDFQAKLKLKEGPLDLASDRQGLQAAIQEGGNLKMPDSLNRSERFQSFMQQFFSSSQIGDDPTSHQALQMQAQFLMPRSDTDHSHV